MALEPVQSGPFYLKPGGTKEDVSPTELGPTEYTQVSGFDDAGTTMRMPGKRLVKSFDASVFQVAAFGGGLFVQYGDTLILYPDACAVVPVPEEYHPSVSPPPPPPAFALFQVDLPNSSWTNDRANYRVTQIQVKGIDSNGIVGTSGVLHTWTENDLLVNPSQAGQYNLPPDAYKIIGCFLSELFNVPAGNQGYVLDVRTDCTDGSSAHGYQSHNYTVESCTPDGSVTTGDLPNNNSKFLIDPSTTAGRIAFNVPVAGYVVDMPNSLLREGPNLRLENLLLYRYDGSSSGTMTHLYDYNYTNYLADPSKNGQYGLQPSDYKRFDMTPQITGNGLQGTTWDLLLLARMQSSGGNTYVYRVYPQPTPANGTGYPGGATTKALSIAGVGDMTAVNFTATVHSTLFPIQVQLPD